MFGHVDTNVLFGDISGTVDCCQHQVASHFRLIHRTELRAAQFHCINATTSMDSPKHLVRVAYMTYQNAL